MYLQPINDHGEPLICCAIGLFWVRPGTSDHADKHKAQDEIYHVFASSGMVVVETSHTR